MILSPLAWLFLGGGSAHARTLDVEEAVSLALARSHSVEAAQAGEAKSRAELRQAFLQFFPKLSATASYTYIDPVPYVSFDMSALSGGGGTDTCAEIDPATLPEGWTAEMAQDFCYLLMSWMAPDTSGTEAAAIPMGLADNYSVQLQAEQLLFAGGAVHSAYQAQRRLHEASEEQVRLARQQAAYDVEQGFYQLVLARRAEEVTRGTLETVEAYVADLSAMVEVGMGSRADLLAAQARASESRLQAMRTAHGAQLAERIFKVYLGMSQDEPLELDYEEEVAPLPLPREALHPAALADRPDLAAMDLNLSALHHYERAAWGSWMPALALVANLQGKNPNYSNEAEWYRSGNITLAASWSLWDRGAALTQAATTRASARQLAAQRDLFSEMLEVEVLSALSSYDEAVAELGVARDGAVAAEEAHRLERERFEQGMANNTQLLQAQAAFSGAQLSVLQAETQLHLAHAALRKAVGIDPKGTP
ncbi:MAG: TolC family protein [Deltaproteobacteria bacterium]|nr:TolC family protein [Deltaproteobacteria bacterium]